MLKTRNCTKCKILKDSTEFYQRKNKLSSHCKICEKLQRRIYCKTEKGLCFKLHEKQKQNSVARSYPLPLYSNIELYEWIISRKTFRELYDNWKSSDYDPNLAPSIDRLDDYKGYSLDNIQLVTWNENRSKSHKDRKNGINNKVNKTVVQYALDGTFIKEYHSTRQASRELNLNSNGGISNCCIGKVRTAYGYMWKYKD